MSSDTDLSNSLHSNSNNNTQEKKSKTINCFVIIGFGMKTDFSTGRVLDLDKTYHTLIKPAFDQNDVNCFRAIDINRSGSIDELMYRWIYQADIVVVDISTLNPNVFYELGVRHAQKPNTTIIMSEKELLNKLPFDINHGVIHSYEHLGEDISADEAQRFVTHLSSLVKSLLESPVERDSPVYTYLRGMHPPQYKDIEQRLAEAEARIQAESQQVVASKPDDKSIEALSPNDVSQEQSSLCETIRQAEEAKNNADYPKAINLFKSALACNSNDVFLIQRLALVTYKSQQPDILTALFDAEKILVDCKPEITTDPETLGLSGAINKRLFEETSDMAYFDKSLWFYEKGFHIKQDYYNGINAAFMYTLGANLQQQAIDAIIYYGQGNIIRKKVAKLCLNLINSQNFAHRDDREWVYQTLAQAYLGLGQEEEAEKLLPEIEAFSKGKFDMQTFKEQNQKLIEAMEKHEKRADIELPQSQDTPILTQGHFQHGVDEPLVISMPRQRSKEIKSIEFNCKINFEK